LVEAISPEAVRREPHRVPRTYQRQSLSLTLTTLINLTKHVTCPTLSGMSSSLIETLAFSEAKAKLSDLMTSVVHGHRPKAVDRHHGKEEMFLLGREEVVALLESFEFHPKVSVSEGEFVVRLPELGLIAGGDSFDEALDELVELAEEYAEQYLARLEFYRETDRRQQLPWVARVAFTPAEERRQLFVLTPSIGRELQPT
jgi:predicted RNase H-like HicB family nuclease